MSFDINDHSFDIPCNSCNHKISEKIGKLKKNSTLICPKCKAPIDVDTTELKHGIDSVEKSLKGFEKNLKNMFK